jgi:hypothetical protein
MQHQCLRGTICKDLVKGLVEFLNDEELPVVSSLLFIWYFTPKFTFATMSPLPESFRKEKLFDGD